MKNWLDTLSTGLDDRKISVSVIGLGYVGLPLVVKSGLHPKSNVYGVDFDKDKIDKLNSNKSYVEDVDAREIEIARENNTVFIDDYSIVSKTDITIICVPTPVDIHGIPDLKYIYMAVESIGKELSKNDKKHIIVLESTTYPTTTEVIVRRELEKFGIKLHERVELCFSPERIDPGNTKFGVQNIPKILGATSDDAFNVVRKFYENMIGTKIVRASSPRVAEFTKLFENIFRQVNIALVNELAILAEKMQIDLFEVINLAATKPFGFLAHYPGPGLGGHCIPVDPYYLLHISKEYKSSLKFVEISSEVNEKMDDHVISLVNIALNRVKKSINGSNIVILGYAYKPNISDFRNSPARPISTKLDGLGAKVSVCDELVEKELIPFDIVDLDTALKTADLVLIITPHSYFNWDEIISSLPEDVPIVDTRGSIDNSRYRKHDIALGKPVIEFDADHYPQ